MAAEFNIEAEFPCSLDELWSFVSHVPNQDHWVFGMSDSEIVDGSEIAVGSTVTGVSTERGQALNVTMKVTEFDPPRRVSWKNDDGHTPFVTVITCSGDETSSRMRYEVTLYPTSTIMRLMMGPLRPVGRWFGNRMMREEIVILKRVLAERLAERSAEREAGG